MRLTALLARPRVRRVAVLLAVCIVTGMVFVGSINAYVVMSVRGGTSHVHRLPHAQVALVLGAFVQPNGKMCTMLADRVQRAVELWRAGKVDRVLVSGDHHTVGYDESDTMRNALLAQGVPARDIFTDYAGFDTWASMVRARKVFGVGSAIVVTQGFHMPRALFLAGKAGLQAWGLTADVHGYGTQGRLSVIRELLARVKGFEQGTFGASVLLGPRIPITGDGRSSWDYSSRSRHFAPPA